VAIAVSLCVSLTTTPMMCAKFLKSGRAGNAETLQRKRTSVSMESGHVCQGFALGPAPPAPDARVTVATICLSVYLYIVVPKGFFPQQIRRMNGSIVVRQTLISGHAAEVEAIHGYLMSDPAVASMSSNTGGGGKYLPYADGPETPSASGRLALTRSSRAPSVGSPLFLARHVPEAVQDINVGGRFQVRNINLRWESEKFDRSTAMAASR